jgi:phosphatidylethanolamine-binding protein (PEBP) family uncharacterized protein
MSALQHSRIVPDVFDAVDFDNEVEMSVEFPTGFKVANGNDIPKDKAQDPPKVQVMGARGLHTLMACDPDAPSPDDPKFREFLHWLVINIPDGDISKGQELVPHVGPAPPAGRHRYIYMLFWQTPPGKLDEIAKEDIDHTIKASPPTDRKNISTRAFAKDHHLRGPVAVRYFYSSP